MCGIGWPHATHDHTGPSSSAKSRGEQNAFDTRIDAIHIGLVSDEPIRIEGLASIFEQVTLTGRATLVPIPGSLDELLARQTLEYLVPDMDSSTAGLEILQAIRRVRPSIRLIVTGPKGNDELVLESIIAGARGYLDLTAEGEMVWDAIEPVTSGSIWEPRRLLSKLIDRLLKRTDQSLTNVSPPQRPSMHHSIQSGSPALDTVHFSRNVAAQRSRRRLA
jgi:DNA-binding NarL/FixJ family response regulator